MDQQAHRSHPKKTGHQQDLIGQEAEKLAAYRAMEESYEASLGESATRRISFLIIVPVLVLVLLAIAIPFVLRTDSPPAGEAPAAAARSRTPERSEPDPITEIDESRVSALSEEDVARAFLESKSWEDRKRFVRNASLAAQHLKRYPDEVKCFPIAIESMRAMGFASPGQEIRYGRFAVRMRSGGRRFLCVVQTEQGPQVDYDAFARYTTATWEELQAGQPASEIRLMARNDSYFNNNFQDETRWICFKLTSPDWPKTAWGYAPRGSITADLLAQLVSTQAQRVTLALRSDHSSHARSQFLIERVVINGWVQTPRDPEEALRMRK